MWALNRYSISSACVRTVQNRLSTTVTCVKTTQHRFSVSSVCLSKSCFLNYWGEIRYYVKDRPFLQLNSKHVLKIRTWIFLDLFGWIHLIKLALALTANRLRTACCWKKIVLKFSETVSQDQRKSWKQKPNKNMLSCRWPNILLYSLLLQQSLRQA